MMTAGGPGSAPVQLTTVPSACLSDPAATVCEYEAGSYPATLVDRVLDTHRQEMAVLLKYVKPTMLKVATAGLDGGLCWHVSDVAQYSPFRILPDCVWPGQAGLDLANVTRQPEAKGHFLCSASSRLVRPGWVRTGEAGAGRAWHVVVQVRSLTRKQYYAY